MTYLVQHQKGMMIIGPTGTGKSVYIIVSYQFLFTSKFANFPILVSQRQTTTQCNSMLFMTEKYPIQFLWLLTVRMNLKILE